MNFGRNGPVMLLGVRQVKEAYRPPVMVKARYPYTMDTQPIPNM